MGLKTFDYFRFAYLVFFFVIVLLGKVDAEWWEVLRTGLEIAVIIVKALRGRDSKDS